jgi:hypothetical protein
MSARSALAASVAATTLALWSLPAEAQTGKLQIGLTEAAEPEGKAWKDPARLSFTIDPNGPDELSVQMNLEAELKLPSDGRDKAAKGYLVWNRETGGDDRQNNLEVGGAFSMDYDPTLYLDRARGSNDDEAARRLDVSSRFSTAYARTAKYADTSVPACAAPLNPPQCRTQFKESIRTSAAFNLFNAHFEQNAGHAFSFSAEPQFGVTHDLLLNSPVDPDTGLRLKGGYLSAEAGIGLAIYPRFDSPRWEITASGRLRQKLQASRSRSQSIHGSAFLFEASATYYVVKPHHKDDWRAGVGITYTRGDDPLRGVSDVNRIVLALRIGRY